MSNFLKILMCLLIVTSIVACKDDDNITQPVEKNNEDYPNYSQLKVGNYWIYERYTLKPDGEEISQNEYDSSYVEKDTIINGETYFKLHRPSLDFRNIPQYYFLKDSLHYIVDNYGQVLFSSKEFNVSLNPIQYSYFNSEKKDTIASFDTRMTDKDSLVNLPGGTFKTLNSKLIITYFGRLSPLGQRESITLYAKDVGVVYATLPFFTSNPNYTIQKLVRYQVD